MSSNKSGKIPVKLRDKIKAGERTQFEESGRLSVKNPDRALILFDWIQKASRCKVSGGTQVCNLTISSSILLISKLKQLYYVAKQGLIETLLGGKKKRLRVCLGRISSIWYWRDTFTLTWLLPKHKQLARWTEEEVRNINKQKTQCKK